MLPPGARGPESPEGIPSRGSGEAHEAGAPSRSTHREAISKRRGGWGSRGPKRPPIRLPWGSSEPPSSFPSLPSAHTEGVGTRGRQPAPGPSAHLQSPGARSSQNRLAQPRWSLRGGVPGVRSFHRHP
ncbi:hypothetical protein NDU88_000305 [Pleurodeles waltl]|uniref:Uncharacterized protein n=1 Tax=Pleurodeles waltl TaxID=8319 RepID=A0AAV7MIH3_PLEWA|nr:hypothetical protein NDU88_000305 [Pleurodeles waltl]